MIERTPIDLLPMFTRGLELCDLEPASQVAIYTENAQRSNYAQAFASAAAELGHSAFVVDARAPFQRVTELSTEYGLSGSPALVDALKDCDLLIDLVMLLFTAEKIEIQASGTRILTCVEPPDVIERLFPTPEYREESRGGAELLRRASTIRVTSAAGTDLRYQLGEMTPLCQYWLGRRTRQVGSLRQRVRGHRRQPERGRRNSGVQRGRHHHAVHPYVRDPVRCTVEGGHIVDVEGAGSRQCSSETSSLNSTTTPRRFPTSDGASTRAPAGCAANEPNHIGLDPRSYRGSVLFSTGPNLDFGGTNSSRCHFDMPSATARSGLTTG